MAPADSRSLSTLVQLELLARLFCGPGSSILPHLTPTCGSMHQGRTLTRKSPILNLSGIARNATRNCRKSQILHSCARVSSTRCLTWSPRHQRGVTLMNLNHATTRSCIPSIKKEHAGGFSQAVSLNAFTRLTISPNASARGPTGEPPLARSGEAFEALDPCLTEVKSALLVT